MKLFLSSYRFGNAGDTFLAMVGEDARVGVITNAKDYKNSVERAKSIQELFDSFGELNINATEIDLRPFFGQAELLSRELEKYDAVWLAGGNAFILRRALKASGADKLLVRAVKDNTLIYAGESAGAVISAPNLEGVEFGDDPYLLPSGYPKEEVWDGLGLVPYSIVPHYESDWEGYERMIDTLEEADIPYKTLTDSQVLVINGDEEERVS